MSESLDELQLSINRRQKEQSQQLFTETTVGTNLYTSQDYKRIQEEKKARWREAGLKYDPTAQDYADTIYETRTGVAKERSTLVTAIYRIRTSDRREWITFYKIDTAINNLNNIEVNTPGAIGKIETPLVKSQGYIDDDTGALKTKPGEIKKMMVKYTIPFAPETIDELMALADEFEVKLYVMQDKAFHASAVPDAEYLKYGAFDELVKSWEKQTWRPIEQVKEDYAKRLEAARQAEIDKIKQIKDQADARIKSLEEPITPAQKRSEAIEKMTRKQSASASVPKGELVTPTDFEHQQPQPKQ